MAPKWTPPNADQLVQFYRSGESVLALSERYGVSRRTIHKNLLLLGVEPRGQGEAQLIAAGRRTPEQNLAMTQAAHAAKRGRPNSDEALERAARSRESLGRFITDGERILADWLRERGMPVRHQIAVGKYNCDLGAEPVAVEVLGGNWHATGDHVRRYPERCKQILDAGWSLILVWDQVRCRMRIDAADEVVAFYERLRRDPPAISEYRVIRGNGELLTSGRGQFDERALIPSQRMG